MDSQTTPVMTPTGLLSSMNLNYPRSDLDETDAFQLPSSLTNSRSPLITLSLPNTPVTARIIPPPLTRLPKRTLSSPATTPPRHKRQRSAIAPSDTKPTPSQSPKPRVPITTIPSTPNNKSTDSQSSSTPSPSTSTARRSTGHTPLRPLPLQSNPHANDDIDPPDPLAPRNPYWEQGYYTIPTLGYYTIRNEPAAEEFDNQIVQPVLDYLTERGYSQYFVHLSHVGYEERTAVPCALVCAKDLIVDDAKAVISLFTALGCKIVQRAFCFTGSTTTFAHHADRYMQHQPTPLLGSSISVENNISAFSLGLFFHLEGCSKQYSLTVQHGITIESKGITPLSTPKIKVQQPAYSDQKDKEDRLREELRMIDLRSKSHIHLSRREVEDDLEELLSQNSFFGDVEMSEMGEAQYNGLTLNSDWAIVKVDASRCGQNIVLHDTLEKRRWLPRDRSGLFYINGTADITEGIRVIKCGRRTGVTQGQIDFVHGKVCLNGTSRTSEYTVLSNMNDFFSERGDSGGPVIDENGNIVGVILGGTNAIPVVLDGHESFGPVIASYITPIHMLKERIEARTGKRFVVDVVDVNKLKLDGVEFV